MSLKTFDGSISKRVWTKQERKRLKLDAKELRSHLKRPLRARDFEHVRLPNRTSHAIKNQALRMGLYKPTRVIQPWSEREKHILIVLARKRELGARGIKKRGFFSDTRTNGTNGQSKNDAPSWRNRSVDSIAQKKRREGFVDPQRSLRAKIANRLSPTQKRKLRSELVKKRNLKSTNLLAKDYGVAPSTIRRYRQQWGIPWSWHQAMALPETRAKRERMADAARERSFAIWKKRKANLFKKFEHLKHKNEEKGTKKKPLRNCAKCGQDWPASKTFFAPSPKRRDGKIIRTYLRRSCRVCYRHQ